MTRKHHVVAMPSNEINAALERIWRSTYASNAHTAGGCSPKCQLRWLEILARVCTMPAGKGNKNNSVPQPYHAAYNTKRNLAVRGNTEGTHSAAKRRTTFPDQQIERIRDPETPLTDIFKKLSRDCCSKPTRRCTEHATKRHGMHSSLSYSQCIQARCYNGIAKATLPTTPESGRPR